MSAFKKPNNSWLRQTPYSSSSYLLSLRHFCSLYPLPFWFFKFQIIVPLGTTESYNLTFYKNRTSFVAFIWIGKCVIFSEKKNTPCFYVLPGALCKYTWCVPVFVCAWVYPGCFAYFRISFDLQLLNKNACLVFSALYPAKTPSRSFHWFLHPSNTDCC